MKAEYKKAMTGTLRAYENLIENLDKNVAKWEDYGLCSGCLLCMVNDRDCRNCPLNTMSQTAWAGGCTTQLYTKLKDILHAYGWGNPRITKKKVLQTVRARYKELLKHLDKLGYEFI